MPLEYMRVRREVAADVIMLDGVVVVTVAKGARDKDRLAKDWKSATCRSC